jgi:hypothetical protein
MSRGGEKSICMRVAMPKSAPSVGPEPTSRTYAQKCAECGARTDLPDVCHLYACSRVEKCAECGARTDLPNVCHLYACSRPRKSAPVPKPARQTPVEDLFERVFSGYGLSQVPSIYIYQLAAKFKLNLN